MSDSDEPSSLFIGLSILVLDGNSLLTAAVGLSQRYGLSQMFIGMTAVSFATSAPELLVSVKAALEGYPALSLGNLVGSNLFNVLGVLGFTAVVHPIIFSQPHLFHRDLIWMLAYAFAPLPLAFFSKRVRLGRWEGTILLTAYAIFFFLPLIRLSLLE